MKLSLAIRFWASTRWMRSTPCCREKDRVSLSKVSRLADLSCVFASLSCFRNLSSKLWVGRGLLWATWSRFSSAANPQVQLWRHTTWAHLGSWARGPRRRCCGSGIITEPQDLHLKITGNKRKRKTEMFNFAVVRGATLHNMTLPESWQSSK